MNLFDYFQTFESLNKKEREEQYKRLKFLLDKSNLYTSYVKNRMERQAAADNKMKIRSQKKKEKKETPAQVVNFVQLSEVLSLGYLHSNVLANRSFIGGGLL